MASRVAVDITVRDLTRGELQRMRQNFRHTGQDLENLISSRTRANFQRFQQSLRSTRADLTRLRGAIPDDEFDRLDRSVRNAQNRLSRGLGRMTVTQLNHIEREVRDVIDAVGDLDRQGDIRIRVDDAELRREQARLERWRREQQRRQVRIQVELDADANRFRQRVQRTLTSPLRTLGSSVSGIMSDGIGQGIISGFRTAGPIGVAILATIIAGAVTAIGAAIAGLLVFALGAAFIGLGVLIAKQTGKIKDQWSDTVASIKDSFRDVGDPLVPSIEKALDLAERLAADFAPNLKRAFSESTPFLDEFMRRLDAGFRKLGKHSFDDLIAGFNAFMIEFGPQLEDFFEELGKSLGALARTVKNNSTEIAAAVRVVLGIINLLVDAINFLANAWVYMFHLSINGAASIIDAWATVVDSLLSGFENILGAATASFSWIPGVGADIEEAKRAFTRFKESTVNNLRQSADGVRSLSETIKRQNRENALTADISQLDAKVRQAKERLQTVTDKKTRAKIQADIQQLLDAKARALRELNSLNGRTATTYITTVHRTTEEQVAPHFAKGGIRGAATGGLRGNMTLVGEQGPELVDLQPGSHVRSNSDTRRLLNNATADGGSAQFVFKSSGRRVDDLLLEILRESIHSRGGNPVTVLGG
jgi:predicted phage tail protein